MTVELMIAAGKSVNVPIYHGDDPVQLAQTLAKTYNINSKA
jgi:hypothetical protein